jgi:hypothetical protein
MNISIFISSVIFHLFSPDWELYKAYPKVDIFINSAYCYDNNMDSSQYALFRFVNKTDRKLKLSWVLEHYQSNVCRTCGIKQKYGCSLILEPKQSREGNCKNLLPELSVFVYNANINRSAVFYNFIFKRMGIRNYKD